MSKYKIGDKIVLTISKVNEKEHYPYYMVNNNESTILQSNVDRYAEPLAAYTEPLEAKIRRQAAEITRLLAENERLKPNYENIRAKGQNEAWELARKIVLPQSQGGMNDEDYKEIFGSGLLEKNIIKSYAYSEVAEKVAEWEKAKEEIKVGDVVSREGLYGVVKSVSDDWLNGITASGISFQWLKHKCTKTGRHIDIDGFLRKIRGENNEAED